MRYGMPDQHKASFLSESDLCAAFIKHLPDGWIAYQEWAGWDILLVRKVDGAQVGIEAKMTLNAKVIDQAAESYDAMQPGPDFRAILVPHGVSGTLLDVCRLIGITVIAMKSDEQLSHWRYRHDAPFRPELPSVEQYHYYWQEKWFDRCPAERHALPDYVPDVVAGKPSPVQLTTWKIKAIKVAITLEQRGYVCRSDFKHLGISITQWTQPLTGWLVPGPVRGAWVSGRLPNFKEQHPVNYQQIAADFEKWKPPEPQIQLHLDDIKKEITE